MDYYNIYLSTEKEKYNYIDLVRGAGAVLAAVSGCGSGYYISIQATPEQVDRINTTWTGAAV